MSGISSKNSDYTGTVGRQKKPFSNNIFPTFIKEDFMPVYTNAFPRGQLLGVSLFI